MFSAIVGAVEQHRVGAGLAFDGVVVVAGVPDEGVVAGPHQGSVVAVAAVEEIVLRPADEDVLAETAIERERDGGGGAVDYVVTALPVHDDPVGGVERRDGGRRRQAGDGRGRPGRRRS